MAGALVGALVPAKILIVDDHLAARTTIRSLLDWHSFQVCGDAKDGKRGHRWNSVIYSIEVAPSPNALAT
jgi:CheY-like chemotaxis protein